MERTLSYSRSIHRRSYWSIVTHTGRKYYYIIGVWILNLNLFCVILCIIIYTIPDCDCYKLNNTDPVDVSCFHHTFFCWCPISLLKITCAEKMTRFIGFIGLKYACEKLSVIIFWFIQSIWHRPYDMIHMKLLSHLPKVIHYNFSDFSWSNFAQWSHNNASIQFLLDMNH